MSTFFKALERAEQERALQRPRMPAAPASEPSSVASETVPTRPSLVVSEAIPSPTRSLFRVPQEAAAALVEDCAYDLDDRLVSLTAPSSFEAEQYRALRHVVEQLRRSSGLTVIAVSSPDHADGKTTTAINLAGALAQAPDARVLLVDADLRAAGVARHVGIDDDTGPGLVDAIMNPKLTLATVAQSRSHLNLSIITAGRRSSAPYEVLKSPRVVELLTEARKKFDYVIVDTPPLVSVPDSRVIGKWVDGFLIVVAAHRTPRRLLDEALNVIEPAMIVGLVFNGDDRHLSRGSYASTRYPVSRTRGRRGRTAPDS